ncbi:MAG: hypothetical protein ACLTUF_07920 [Waltera sp.]|uniref:hypothetical protein n=1 Tax=Waltera sp. TaxID=2815806 RepID=UPI0039932D4C
MAVIFLTALIVCVIMLAVLQFAFEMDTYVGYFLAVGAGAVAISYVCIKYWTVTGNCSVWRRPSIN